MNKRAKYIWKWPTTLKSVQPCVRVLVFSYFELCIERLGQYFEANRIVGEENAAKRRSTFLSVVGPGPYQLLRSILALVKPSEKMFEELTEVLKVTITRHHRR